ncbi:MAG: hypothetical protein SGJ21_14845 [Alphaproteobacteria bacterium]|nr:hypothetical protein [Alphaproteobacteria bacterium]
MRLILTLIVIAGVGFLALIGFYWMREGSLEEAGREVDSHVEALDRSTEDLQKEVGDVGDAAVDTVKDATDGDDRT